MTLPVLGQRTLFGDLEAAAYLNHAAISPPSAPVRAAVREVLDSYARLGTRAFGRWQEQRERLRQKLARLIGADSGEDIAFVANTTSGITDIALCFPWRAGDRVLGFEGEFPTNVTPWQRAAEHFGLELELLPRLTAGDDVEPWLARLGQRLERGARLLAVSAVQFQSGLRMPLREIGALCAAHGAQLFVDAIQACGAVPIDVREERIDYLACGAHKWLMGIEGAGFLYVAPERVASLRPLVAGWLSHEGALRMLLEGPGRLRYDLPIRARADFVEGGIANSVGLAALEAALYLLQSLGIESIFGHVSGYLDALEPELVSRGFSSLRARYPEGKSGILSVRPPPGVDVIALFHALDPDAVACSTPDGVLRFAPHWPNAHAEVEGVVAAVDAALARVRGS